MSRKRKAPATGRTAARAKHSIAAGCDAEGSKTNGSGRASISVKVRRNADGHCVELWGTSGGRLTTIAGGLDLDEAIARAASEAEQRGFQFDCRGSA